MGTGSGGGRDGKGGDAGKGGKKQSSTGTRQKARPARRRKK